MWAFLQENHEALRTILDGLPNPVFLKDRAHRWVIVNRAMCELMGQPSEGLVGRSDYDLLPKSQADIFWAVDDEVFTTGEPRENEEVITDSTGALRVIVTRKCLVRLPSKSGEEPFILAVISDVTRFREAEAQAQYHAQHDVLTGIPNRVHLGAKLEEAVDAARRDGEPFALLSLDLDGFKAVNDEHGHAAGDQVLRIVAQRLSRAVRSTDVVARLGGDEFCVVQRGGDQPTAAVELAERIVAKLSAPMSVGSHRTMISVSIGIAVYPTDATSAEQLLQCADLALYNAKRRGKNTFCRFEIATPLANGKEWDVEADLRHAIERGELKLAFQPVASAADGGIKAFEALVRWSHPMHGEVSPAIIIPVAERSGLIHPLGQWVLGEACRTAVLWPWPAQLCVNVSPLQIEAGDFPQIVREALAGSGLPPERLELEITESALLGNVERVLEVFRRLKELGVGLALDDFGLGWSSLDTLRSFPFDRIKIDQSFVAHMQSDTRAAAIVRAVLSLGHSLNLPITAEGVENVGQLATLRQMGCDDLQGYLIGRPGSEATAPNREPWEGFPNRAA